MDVLGISGNHDMDTRGDVGVDYVIGIVAIVG